MSANATFSTTRFMQMVKAHWVEKKRTYFWFFAIISMIYFFILLLFTINEPVTYNTEVQAFFYYIGLITTGYVFALRYFSDMARPESALLALMQPTSTLEKWLLAVIMVIVVYPLIYTLLFVAMTFPISEMSLADNENQLRYQLFIPLKYMIVSDYSELSAIEQIPAWIIYLAICGYAVTTSVLFKKLPMIKSFALGFCLFLFFLLLLIGVVDSKTVALTYWFDGAGLMRNVQCNQCAAITLSNVLFWVIPPTLLWAASFWALKERDIS